MLPKNVSLSDEIEQLDSDEFYSEPLPPKDFALPSRLYDQPDISFSRLPLFVTKDLLDLAYPSEVVDEDLAYQIVTFLSKRKDVTKLDLSNATVSTAAVCFIANALAKNLVALTGIKFQNNHLASASLIALANALAVNSTLTEVDLSHNAIGSQEAKALANALEKNTTLKSLNVSHSSIPPGGTIALGEMLQKNKSLAALDVSCNSIDLEGAEAFSKSIANNCVLTELNVSDCKMPANGVCLFATALEINSSITILDLSNNEIDSLCIHAFIQSIKVNKQLKCIGIKAQKIIDSETSMLLAEVFEEESSLRGIFFTPSIVTAKTIARRFYESRIQNKDQSLHTDLGLQYYDSDSDDDEEEDEKKQVRYKRRQVEPKELWLYRKGGSQAEVETKSQPIQNITSGATLVESKATKRSFLADIPTVIHCSIIIKYLPLRDILSIFLTCRSLNSLSKQDSFWSRLTKRQYPSVNVSLFFDQEHSHIAITQKEFVSIRSVARSDRMIDALWDAWLDGDQEQLNRFVPSLRQSLTSNFVKFLAIANFNKKQTSLDFYYYKIIKPMLRDLKIDSFDDCRRTLLHLAAICNQPYEELEKLLKEAKQSGLLNGSASEVFELHSSVLNYAVQYGNVRFAESYIALIGEHEDSKQLLATLLHTAMKYAQLPFVAFLVKNDIDLEVDNDIGKTALDIAIDEVLASPRTSVYQKQYAIIYRPSKIDFLKCIQFLVSKGAKINNKNDFEKITKLLEAHKRELQNEDQSVTTSILQPHSELKHPQPLLSLAPLSVQTDEKLQGEKPVMQSSLSNPPVQLQPSSSSTTMLHERKESKDTALAEEKSDVLDEKQFNVTLLGDSTIDNRVWVDGFIKSYFNTRLGIKRDSASERIRKSHRRIGKPELSVVENVMDMLPGHVIHDYTNDGFTTTDVLYGATRDKVFGTGTFSLFPHEYFRPLEAGAESIKKSQHIIVSIGGNDFREFLLVAANKEGQDRADYIRNNLDLVLSRMRNQYVEIIRRIRVLNKDAQIILMTQYYPSATQNTYGIYPFMKEIGEILNLGGVHHNPMSVIHEIMKMTYADVLKRVPHENMVVVDITSSLNPFDDKNHVSQIEPSGLGGKKIATMLKYVMTSVQVTSGHAYRFYPEFFTLSEQDQHVEETAFSVWAPAHPWDLREGYSVDEEKVFRKYNADQLYPDDLLQRLDQALEKLDKTNPVYKAAQLVREEAKNISHDMPEDKMKKWKMSVVLALNVLETPKTLAAGGAQDSEQKRMTKISCQNLNRLYLEAIYLLKDNAERSAIGKADSWKKFKGALAMLAGAAIIALSIAGIPFTTGASLTGFYAAGSLLSLGGAAFFYSNRQKSLAKVTANLANEAKDGLLFNNS